MTKTICIKCIHNKFEFSRFRCKKEKIYNFVTGCEKLVKCKDINKGSCENYWPENVDDISFKNEIDELKEKIEEHFILFKIKMGEPKNEKAKYYMDSLQKHLNGWTNHELAQQQRAGNNAGMRAYNPLLCQQQGAGSSIDQAAIGALGGIF